MQSPLVTPEVVLALCDAAEQLAEAEQDGKEMFAKFGKACDERDTAEQQLVAARVELSRIEHALDDPEKTCGELSAEECNERFGLAKVRITDLERDNAALRTQLAAVISTAEAAAIAWRLQLATVRAETFERCAVRADKYADDKEKQMNEETNESQSLGFALAAGAGRIIAADLRAAAKEASL